MDVSSTPASLDLKCELYDPRRPHLHGKGRLIVSALSRKYPPTYPRQTFTVCIWCLHSLTQAMRRSDYYDIRVTSVSTQAPQEPSS